MADPVDVLSALVLRPGDKVLVAVADEHLSNERADNMARSLGEHFPDVGFVIIGGATIAVQRAEP
jgi:hypothetical protein